MEVVSHNNSRMATGTWAHRHAGAWMHNAVIVTGIMIV